MGGKQPQGKPGERPARVRSGRFWGIGEYFFGTDSELDPPPILRREVEVVYPPRPVPPPEPDVLVRQDAHLALDFGTSAITAALVATTGGLEILEFQRAVGTRSDPLLDSLYTRRAGLDRSDLIDNYELDFLLAPGDSGLEFYPCLKRRIELLARTETSTRWQAAAVLDVAALCCSALRRVPATGGKPLSEWLQPGFRIYLSVPNAFPATAVRVLKEGVAYGAAAATGAMHAPQVEVILEAEAVAYHDLKARAGSSEPPPDRLLVLDAGAGTTDASIVQWENGALRVVAHAGLPVGGLDLDAGIMSRHPAYTSLLPRAFSQALGGVQSLKEEHWGTGGDDAVDPGPPDQATLGLADALAGAGWERKGLAEYLALVRRRYLALAVRGLLECLPRRDLEKVKAVVISGRASLLRGFRPEVERVLQGWGISAAVSAAEQDKERKLAVVRGVGKYAAEPGSRQGLRPTRASFEMVVRYRTGEAPLPLIQAGAPLDGGWGVQSWYHPLDQNDYGDDRVDVRLLPQTAISVLSSEDALGWTVDDLAVWSVLTTLVMEDPLPFRAGVAYDFLSRHAVGFCNGKVKEIVESPDPALGVGRFHPVHRQRENWFERSHQEIP